MACILTLTQFTPAEAERITGVTAMAQRDWRRRGIIVKAGEGHARYNLFELAELYTIKLLSDRGVSLADASDVAEWCGMGIGYRALGWVDAYEGDHGQVGETLNLPETDYSESELDLVRRACEAAGVDFRLPNPRWGATVGYLTRRVYRQTFGTGLIPGSLFIWWANGEHVFHESFDAARAEMTSSDARLAGPAIILDFASLASVLIDRAGRAFVHVEIDDLPDNPDEQPTSGDVGNLSAEAPASAQQKEEAK